MVYSYDKTGRYDGDLERAETSYSVSKGGSWKNTTGNVQLNYARTFGKHEATAMLVYNVDQKWGEGRDDAGEFAPPLSYNGYAARATYGYDGRYLLELNLGYNGSTHFAKDKRYDYFPAFSVGWVVSEERFWKEKIDAINFFKIRGSWGILGNDNAGESDYDYYYTQTYYQRAGGDGDGSLYWGYPGEGTTTQKFLVEGTLGNNNVTWEKGRKANIGLDVRMFSSKLTFSFDYFHEFRYDILGIPYNVPLVLGMGNPTENLRGLPPANINRVANSGIDVELSYDGRIGGFQYYAKGNFTFARNRYTAINEENVVYEWQSRKGRPIGQLFGLTDIGLYQLEDFQTDAQGNLVMVDNYPALREGLPIPQYGPVWPGDCRYQDLNGDGVVDKYDQGAIGKSKIPEYTYGVTLGGEWKGLDFNVLFQGAGGANMFLREFAMWEFYSSSGDNGKVMRHHLGRYNPEDSATWSTATYPRLHYGLNTNNHQSTTRWMFDRSYLRLKNVEVGYTLPQKWLGKINVASCRVFASGTNIFTWDHMMDWDPESSSETGSAYPQIRSWSFGVNIQF
jgi:TonB-linked SusC/RagA family outer membrane protein